MSEIEKRTMNDDELLNHIRLLRLNEAKKYLTAQIQKGEKEEEASTWKKVEIFFSRQNNKIHNYEDRLAKTEVAIAKIEGEYPNPFTDEEAIDYVEERFSKEGNEIAKLLFAVKIIMDNEVKFEREQDGLKVASTFFYGDPNKLLNLRKKLANYYRDLASAEIGQEEKTALIAIAAIGLTASFVVPAAAAPAIIASSVGAKIATLSVAVAAGCLLTASMVGGAYFLLDETNRVAAKREFLSFTPERQALTLAMELLVVDEMKSVLGAEDFKEKLDSILKTLAEFKGDIDYLLFVEKQNTSDNRDKLTQFHRFDKKMLQILY